VRSDFRKKLRAVRDEDTEFNGDDAPIFVANATGVQEALNLFDRLYDMYGDLNDLWCVLLAPFPPGTFLAALGGRLEPTPPAGRTTTTSRRRRIRRTRRRRPRR
jgi:hypothetical protein